MTRYIALLRGINVGGKNKIAMVDLKVAFEKRGFQNVATYINSGNVIFDSDLEKTDVRNTCEKLILEDFGLDITTYVISASELTEALRFSPSWWNNAPHTRHDVFFVIPPMTATKLCAHVGEIKKEYEKLAHYGELIFWSTSMDVFSKTRWSKISQDKEAYSTITVRNANTVLKLAELAKR